MMNSQNRTTTSRGLTPLMRAAAIGQLESVVELLQEGADVNEIGPRGSTALMFAAGGGHLEVVCELVSYGADMFAKEEGGWTALCHAKEDNDTEIVSFLERAMERLRSSSPLGTLARY